MSSKDKEKTLQDRLKQFFRLNKGGSGNIKGRVDFSLTKDLEGDIGPESPIQHRIKIIRDLSEAVLQSHLEEFAIEKLWTLTQDLLQEEVAKEHRHVVFQFLCSLAQGQADKLGLMRAQFFRLITSHSLPEDIGPRLDLLRSLTDNGKDILYIEEQVAPFLLNWVPAVTGANKTHDLLSLLVNLVKYNAAYIEESTISGFIQNTCFLCSWSQQEEVVLASLALLDVIVCYAQIPPDMLENFISTLCVCVNNKNFCQSCWMIMRKLLGTHLGHSALLHMCRMMQEPSYSSNATLLRGAVFHISMGMWGSQRVTTLYTTASAVLPSFVQVVKANHVIVTYEIILCVRRLICQSPQDLTDSAWDPVLDILEEAVSQVSQPNYPHQIVSSTLHDTITNVESLYEKGEFRGEVSRFFRIIDLCAASRPEPSVLRLISYLAADLTPTQHEWLTNLKDLLERYFWRETRTNIRVKTLDILSSVLHTNRALYEEELVDRVLGQLDVAVTKDPDHAVRNATVQLLVEMGLECDTKRFLELLDLIEKFLNRPFELHDADGSVVTGEAEALDVKSAALGMIKIFKVKAYQLPSTHAIRAYRALVNHLENHYRHPKVFENCSSIRFLIFRCFMQIRADSCYHLGIPEALILDEELDSSPLSSPLRYSPYLAVDHRFGERPAPAAPSTPAPAIAPTPAPTPTPSTTQGTTPSPQTAPPTPPPATFPAPVVTNLSLQHACKAVIICLKQEKDWRVLNLVLKELPQVLQNKAIVLSRHGNDIEYLASALCTMISDKTLALPESLRNVPITTKLSRSDFQSLVLVTLASLASYPLEPNLQQRLIKCLQVGLASRCAGACVSALTLCTLEMRDTMYKLLPEVLLNLSKISATVHVAIPILEFLSTLTRLPKVFASFVGDQYMSVFAIALPYTNPFKYNHYTVSLAHHVIAVWFLKCRLPFRRDFVKFIITGLKANVLVPFEDQKKKPDIVNEDSSNRKRSSSLTEQGSRRREQLTSQQRLDMKPAIDENLLTFHTELTETCIDLMARHTFSSCAALPRRLSSAEWLLTGGHSMTWLLGHRLVTVTTSGCTQKAIRGGYCDKCLSSCRLLSPEKPVPTSPLTEPPVTDMDLTPSRRRHKSAIQRSVSGEQMTPLAPRTKDDLHMNSMSPSAKVTDSELQTRPEQLMFNQSERTLENSERALCSCWCQGWAEIHVRRPTGNISWITRLQNPPYLHASSPLAPDFPMSDISTLFLASLGNNEGGQNSLEVSPEPEVMREPPFEPSPAPPATLPLVTTSSNVQSSVAFPDTTTTSDRPSSEAVPVPGSSSSLDRDSEDECSDVEAGQEPGVRRRRNPVRRSNSSPEMSGRLKSPLVPPALSIINPLQGNNDYEIPPPSPGPDDKKLSTKLPPTRVSCEAIPEEMAGTTPPSTSSDNAVPPMQLTNYPSVTLSPNPPPVTSPPATGSNMNSKTIVTPSNALVTPTVSTPPPNVSNTLSPVTPNTAASTVNKTTLAPTRSAPPQQLPPLDKPRVERSPPQDNRPDPSALPPLAFRDRGHTISVMSPVRKPDWGALRRSGGPASPRSSKDQAPRSGINPSFVFLQLYHDGQLGVSGEKPLLVAQSEMVNLALRTLDYIPPYETHKLGVLYVGPGQANNEQAILQNQAGTTRYMDFLKGLGQLVRLKDVDPQTTFLGGLDVNGNDGKFAYIWQDAMTQVIFHTATLMPTKETDPSCNNKKLHIGNDYVTIVFNESGEDYNVQCIKGQFNFACVVINPVGHGTNQVTVKAKEVLGKHLGALETRVISDQSLPTLVRQLALHANLASMIVKQTQAPYASNWLERLRHIKRLRARVCSSSESATSETRSPPSGLQKRVQMDDFTEYTHYK